MLKLLGIIYYILALASLIYGLQTFIWSCESTHTAGVSYFAVPFFLIFVIPPALLRLGRSTLSKASLEDANKESLKRVEALLEKRWKEEEEGVVNYVIDNNGTNPIGDLPIGARVTDHSWEWEFRTDKDDSVSEDVKSVTWIVVAKNHYDGLEAHVTLLAVDLIGFYALDNSTSRGSDFGSNHWGESGTANATYGLRPWLNSTGIHAGEGFYRTFSDSFKEALLETTLPNKEWKNGTAYSTQDHVFLPSTTELGYRLFSSHDQTYRIGKAYAYFSEVSDLKRVALFDGKPRLYWTRSPASSLGDYVRIVDLVGKFYNRFADGSDYGVRPALNLKSGILVSEIRN